jgi:hypothetical protein
MKIEADTLLKLFGRSRQVRFFLSLVAGLYFNIVAKSCLGIAAWFSQLATTAI